jgi:4-diphosphocytidyl-2-C-methyl-D-erythritol kinase
VQVPTAVAYAAPELTRNTEPLKIEDFSAQSQGSRFHNDLEPVVTARFPEVREHLAWLRKHGDARMTGSGSCVFAAFDDRESAERVIGALPGTMRGFVAQGMRQHPLRGL